MGNKKHTPTHSQTLGILWLSVALLIFATVVFFSSQHHSKEAETDTLATLQEVILTQKEDSVYHSRRKHHHNTHKTKQQKQKIDSTFYTKKPPTPTKQPLVVDLNTADTLTLQLLHGIGPTFAKRIVRYRERLGGFIAHDQLLEVYGFTPELLAHIKSHLILDTTAIRTININSVELKQLARHPYMEYNQALDIIRLRQRGVRFHNADDLRTVPSIADSTLQRMLPYLDFSDSLSNTKQR